MAYINYNELAARYRIFDTASISNVSSDTIYYAEREIETILAPTFTVPFEAAHPGLKDLVIDMAYARYMFRTNPEKGEPIYKMVIKRAEAIRDGKQALITGSGSMASTLTAVDLPGDANENYHPIHSLLDAEDNVIDTDRIDALEDEREDDY